MQVPTYSNLQTSETATPDVNLSLPGGPNAEQIQGQQLQGLGDATQRAGDAGSHIALAMQDQVNQTKVNDAVNQARVAAQSLAYDPQTGYLNLRGNSALTRPNGQALPEEYGNKLQDSVSQIAGGLGNEAQRRAFQLSATDIQAQFHGQVESHMLGEFKAYHSAVNDATVALATNDAKLNWSNPDKILGYVDAQGNRIPGAIDAIKAATMANAQAAGMVGAPADKAILDAVSNVHSGVVMAALENNNPQYALHYLDHNKGEMTGDDILKLQGHVNQAAWMNMSAQAVGSAATAAMPAFAPSGFDRMKQITAQSESGGRETNADGSTVTSPKGAQGVMQVMPATNKDPGFGVRPAQDDSAQERARVGSDYLQAMLQRYGDPAKAWAAYNAGPGALDKAMADANTQRTSNWLGNLPQETQAYVAKNMQALGTPSGGMAPRPTEIDFVNQALSALPPGAAPQLVQMTREHAISQYGVITKSFAERGQQALSAVQGWLFANKDRGVTIADVPPELMDPVMRFAPGDARNLEAFSKTIQRGDQVTNLSRYNDIVSNMDQYAKMSQPAWDQLQTELSPKDFTTLSRQRADFVNGGTDDSSGGLNRAQINRSLNEHLSTLQMPTSVKPGDTAGNERLGAVRMFVDNSIFAAQRDAGKKFTPQEVAAHIDGLFAKDVTFKNTVFGFETGGTTSTNLMSMQVGDIPSATLAQIKSALARQGKVNPTNTDIINTYRIAKMKQQ